MSELLKNLHVPLPQSVYGDLRSEARRAGRPVTQIAREAILRWIEERRRAQTEVELEAYVTRVAGSTDDLDPALESAGLEHLRESEPPKRKRRR